MSLVAETGAVVSGANAYATVAQAAAYLADRAREAEWSTLTTGEKEGRLIMATQYLDASVRWRGAIVSSVQALAWPRFGVADAEGREIASDTVPAAVRWRRPSIEAFGLVEARVPVVIALEHELPTVSRGDVLDLGEDRYAVIGVERTGLGRVEMRLEKQA